MNYLGINISILILHFGGTIGFQINEVSVEHVPRNKAILRSIFSPDYIGTGKNNYKGHFFNRTRRSG